MCIARANQSWQELEKATWSSASIQLLQASTFIVQCGYHILDSVQEQNENMEMLKLFCNHCQRAQR